MTHIQVRNQRGHRILRVGLCRSPSIKAAGPPIQNVTQTARNGNLAKMKIYDIGEHKTAG